MVILAKRYKFLVVNKEVTIMSFGKKLTRLRKERGWTQQDLADKIGMSVMQIKRYEADQSSPSLDVIRNITKIMKIIADQLISENGDNESEYGIDDKIVKIF